MSMYIRVKRKMTTYFVHCEPSETVSDVKRKLEALVDRPAAELQLRLIVPSVEGALEEGKTLAEQKVENDCALALAYKLDSGDFEPVQIDKPAEYGSADVDNA